MQALRIDFILEACANTEQNYVSNTQDFTPYIYIHTDKERTKMRERHAMFERMKLRQLP